MNRHARRGLLVAFGSSVLACTRIIELSGVGEAPQLAEEGAAEEFDGDGVVSSSGDHPSADDEGAPAPDAGETEGEGGSVATAAAGDGDTTISDSDSSDPMGESGLKLCAELVDDLEDGSPFIPRIGGRSGAWYIYNDESVGATQEPVELAPLLAPNSGDGAPTSDGIIPTTLYSARTSGEGFMEWGAGMGVDLNHPACANDTQTACTPSDGAMPYDLSMVEGLSFYTKAYTEGLTIVFQVATQGTTPVAVGGTCENVTGGQCDAHYETMISVVPEWAAHEISFAMLAQPAYAGTSAVEFDPSTVLSLRWQVPTGVTFDFAVDELCLY